jgi:hypothetical protein
MLQALAPAQSEYLNPGEPKDPVEAGPGPTHPKDQQGQEPGLQPQKPTPMIRAYHHTPNLRQLQTPALPPHAPPHHPDVTHEFLTQPRTQAPSTLSAIPPLVQRDIKPRIEHHAMQPADFPRVRRLHPPDDDARLIMPDPDVAIPLHRFRLLLVESSGPHEYLDGRHPTHGLWQSDPLTWNYGLRPAKDCCQRLQSPTRLAGYPMSGGRDHVVVLSITAGANDRTSIQPRRSEATEAPDPSNREFTDADSPLRTINARPWVSSGLKGLNFEITANPWLLLAGQNTGADANSTNGTKRAA